MAKVFVFSYFFWLVLCLIFITGTTRISVFCLGYLVACFYFMLFGSSLLMQPVRHVLRLWDWLIAYTCLVIAMKNLLSVSEGGRRKGGSDVRLSPKIDLTLRGGSTQQQPGL